MNDSDDSSFMSLGFRFGDMFLRHGFSEGAGLT